MPIMPIWYRAYGRRLFAHTGVTLAIPLSVQESHCDGLMNTEKLSYIPEIDGLRALAILGVLFFHLHLRFNSLGWTGVELFFVLSGFLITRILLSTRGKPHYFRTFYTRRTLRIFPIYYLVIILVALAGGERGVAPYYLTYSQTITQLRSSFADAPMLGHTWTLAIEEQFYLVWPLVILMVTGRRLLGVLGAMFIGSLAIRYALQSHASPFLIDGWIGVQLDTFALGALLAYLLTERPRQQVQRWCGWALLAGSAAVIGLVGAVGLNPFWTPYQWAHTPYGPWVITIFALTSVGVTGMAATRHPLVSWLSAKPLVALGKISYGLYLYHPFVFAAVSQVMDRLGRFPLRGVVWPLADIGCSIIVAQGSWLLIETPFLRLKERMIRPAIQMKSVAVV
jgi:peptidoglycan/LPS O-acetylase OafA/YrhL